MLKTRPSKKYFFINLIVGILLLGVPPIGIIYVIVTLANIPYFFFTYLEITEDGVLIYKKGNSRRFIIAKASEISEVRVFRGFFRATLKVKLKHRFRTLKIRFVPNVDLVAAEIIKTKERVDNAK